MVACALAWTLPVLAEPDVTNAFDAYMATEVPPADGFDFPVGDRNGRGSYVDPQTGKRHRGWYLATRFGEEIELGIHPGEDWNGRGGGNTDLGQPVRAVANGKVVHAADCGDLWGGVVIIQHVYYQNHEKKRIRSLYAHLGTLEVKKGEVVTRRQLIGTIGQDPERRYYAHLHLELRRDETFPPTYWPTSHDKELAWVREHYAPPSAFLRAHRKLFVPGSEPVLVLIDQATYRMRLYEKGELAGEYDVSFGQASGRKRVRGDNRTPKGMYFVVDRSRGPFGGDYGAYYGGHWIKINYPNAFDAERGVRHGYLNRARAAEIGRAWRERRPTFGRSRLGGGIGFHGWIEEWEDDGPRHLSWGCIVMHNRDIKKVYGRMPEGSMVVIF
jgi:murein DD-endopeptidase MepM/ murein hydrolase activator NlpD